jgi:hypothetical protein
MLVSTLAAIMAQSVLHLAINPLFIGLAVSAVLVTIGIIMRPKRGSGD